MQLDMQDVLMVLGFLICAIAILGALREQRLTQLSPLLALAVALVSNYLFSGLADATLVEIATRWLLAFVLLRLVGVQARRMTVTAPIEMRYASESLVMEPIEFEEVKK